MQTDRLFCNSHSIAQLVEHLTLDPEVLSSNPTVGNYQQKNKISFLLMRITFIYKFHALCNPSQGRMDIWGLRIEKWSSFSIPGVESLWYCFRPRDGKVFPTPGVGKVIPHQGLEKWFHPLRQSSVHRDTNSHFRGPKITGLETKGNGVSMKEIHIVKDDQ